MPCLRTGEHSNSGFALVAGPDVARSVVAPVPATSLPAIITALLHHTGPPSAAQVLQAAGS